MGALGPILQSHLMDVAGDAQTLAAASHHAAFNTANALGPWLGGMAITANDYSAAERRLAAYRADPQGYAAKYWRR